jgi:hypothetical protein
MNGSSNCYCISRSSRIVGLKRLAEDCEAFVSAPLGTTSQGLVDTATAKTEFGVEQARLYRVETDVRTAGHYKGKLGRVVR